eukprot:COSAG05_NODE_549_length_8747_cov_8.305851_7_plen_63_part_00
MVTQGTRITITRNRRAELAAVTKELHAAQAQLATAVAERQKAAEHSATSHTTLQATIAGLQV